MLLLNRFSLSVMVPMNGRIARLTLLIVSVLFILPTSSLSSMQKEDEQDTTNSYPLSLQLTQDDKKILLPRFSQGQSSTILPI